MYKVRFAVLGLHPFPYSHKQRNTRQQYSQSNLPTVLSEKTCAELTATTKKRKVTERDHSIKTRLARAKEQAKQPTVAEGKQNKPLVDKTVETQELNGIAGVLVIE